MLPALHCHNTVAMKTPNERERHRTKFTLGAGAVLHVPHGICLATVFNWLRHRNEAPKSALHFGLGRYRLYWNRFHIGTGSRYPTLVMTAFSRRTQFLTRVMTAFSRRTQLLTRVMTAYSRRTQLLTRVMTAFSRGTQLLTSHRLALTP